MNSINPNAKPKNQRIYSFHLTDRENFKVKLDNPSGVSIKNNLSVLDLFTFDVFDSDLRSNFEKLFTEYEADSRTCVENILEAEGALSRDIGNLLIEVFRFKMLNFIRNPFSIEKAINSFPTLMNLAPVDRKQRAIFDRVLAGRRPHQKSVCDNIGIDFNLYSEWLALLFLLLSPKIGKGRSVFDEVIYSLFKNKNNFISIYLYQFSDKSCLLSDRGYVIPINELEGVSAWDFNLSSNLFVRYAFQDLRSIGGVQSQRFSELQNLNGNQVQVTKFYDDLNELSRYNQRTVYQCYQNVYCSESEVFGVNF